MPYRRKPYSRCILASKEELRSKVKHFSFTEARRLNGPIYDVLVKELLEEGCLKAARYFLCMMQKENAFFDRRLIRDRVRDDRKLLLSLHEKAKLAEMAMVVPECGGMATVYELLYQCLEQLERRGYTYFWLQEELFKKTTDLFRRHGAEDNKSLEMKARVFHKYGLFFVKNGQLAPALDYFRRALDIVRSQNWVSEKLQANGEQWTLHKELAQSVTHQLIAQSKRWMEYDTARSLDLTREAILTAGEATAVGTEPSDIVLLCQARLAYALVLKFDSQIDKALRELRRIVGALADDHGSEAEQLACEVYRTIAACYTNSDITQEHENLKIALNLARKQSLKSSEAQILISLGRLYELLPKQHHLAKPAFELSKKLFTQLGEKHNRLQTLFLLAKLKVEVIFPIFVELMKDPDHFCRFYALKSWKHNRQPFWLRTGEYLFEDSPENKDCLIEIGSNETQIFEPEE